jgi:transcriptional regulator with XRE-family HTH domain
MSTLAAALEEARLRRGLSKRAAAVELGCSEMSYGMWARGVWIPDAARAQALAAFTGKDRVEILGLLGLLDEDQVATLMAKHRPTSPKARRRMAAGVAPAQASATLPEDQGAYLSSTIFGPLLARVA